MRNIIRLTIPSVLSILAVWAIFAVEATIHNLIVAPYEDSQANYSFFILPVIVISILIQAILIIPIWRKFISKGVVFGISLIPFFTVLCVIGGLACGYVLSVKKFGLSDLVSVLALYFRKFQRQFKQVKFLFSFTSQLFTKTITISDLIKVKLPTITA